ncbi:eukaryotic translation initiation factor 3 subunit C [Tothia fuscella]|uniref:Eukaryotic translation initiation factor 3 subunit C n=1 Tax=Tothia fuscella TaxID=1048955 RepID=A0A9P4NX05_9PEZI|nr:eukaryotic translation initiation factor 3 subunit C [Tothia fuscella]
MSSRFFARGGDSDDSSSDSDEELYDIEGVEEEKSEKDSSEEDSDLDDDDSDSDSSSDEEGATGVNRFLKKSAGESNFLKGDDSDESDEERTAIVRSAKDKRTEELEALIRLTENAMKIGDFIQVQNEFDKLLRVLPTVTKQMDGKTPKMFIKVLSDLEANVTEAYEKQKVTPKKMNALNSKALNATRQKVRKLTREDQYTKDIEAYRTDAESFMKEEAVIEIPEPKKKKVVNLAAGESITDADLEGFEVVGPGGKALIYTPESILKHLRSVAESRGRKGTDRIEQIRVMEKLFDVSTTDYQRIRVLVSLVAARFDTSTTSGGAMAVDQWKLAHQEFVKLVDLLHANQDELVVIEGAEEWEDDEKHPTFTEGQLFNIPGSIVGAAERLDDELTRSLLAIDPHTSDYVSRLTDETAAYTDLLRAQVYEERVRKNPALKTQADRINSIILKRLEHMHFRQSHLAEILEKDAWAEMPKDIDSEITPKSLQTSPDALVKSLTNYLFKNSEGIQRARAILHRTYFAALHDQYYDAKNMMLMSHLSETIGSFDIVSQIHYNRTLVQVGLAAFRLGLIWESQTALQEICGSNRQKELLAQGVQVQRYSTLTPEQERAERSRQLPFHMHINIELLEACYLVVSMLLEIPLLAQLGTAPDQKRRIISKAFRRLLDYSERSVFQGPPENTRDHILQASKALSAGDYRKSIDLIKAIKIWDLIPAKADEIRNMLESKIKETGLETYLLTYAPFYETIHTSTLASMFDLSERQVSAIVARMISHEELAAALDQVTHSIIFRKGVDLSRLQALSLTLSEKASGLIESNEKTLEQRTQGTANAFERQGGRGRGGRGGGRGRGGGGRGNFPGGQNVPRGQGFTGGALGIRT